MAIHTPTWRICDSVVLLHVKASLARRTVVLGASRDRTDSSGWILVHVQRALVSSVKFQDCQFGFPCTNSVLISGTPRTDARQSDVLPSVSSDCTLYNSVSEKSCIFAAFVPEMVGSTKIFSTYAH